MWVGARHFLALLRAERGCETHLSEYSATVCALAAPRVDFAWPGDFLALDSAAVAQRAGAMPGPGVFDCITFLDSLEHAADPGQWLDKAHGLLREGLHRGLDTQCGALVRCGFAGGALGLLPGRHSLQHALALFHTTHGG
jgi:hypothetical protein